MARYPDAFWNPLGTPGGKIVPRLVIVHTMGVNAFARPKASFNSLEWTFGVHWSGKVEQHADTTVRTDANYKANTFAISIETEDDGDPDRQPWSEEQMTSLARLIRWCCDTHNIPKRRADKWDGTGIGFHTMWGAPSQWTPVAKSCPGAARKVQFPRLLEMVVSPEHPPTDEEADVAVIIKHHGGTRNEVTDWVTKHGIPSNAVLAELQAKGLKVVEVSDALADSIPLA